MSSSRPARSRSTVGGVLAAFAVAALVACAQGTSQGDDDPVDARRVDARLSDARPIDGPMATDARPIDARPPDGSILPPDGGMMGMCTQDTQCPATDCCFGGLMCVPGQRTGLPPPLNCLPN